MVKASPGALSPLTPPGVLLFDGEAHCLLGEWLDAPLLLAPFYALEGLGE